MKNKEKELTEGDISLIHQLIKKNPNSLLQKVFEYAIALKEKIESFKTEINDLKYNHKIHLEEKHAEDISYAVSFIECEKDEEIEKIKSELEDYKGMFESAKKLIQEQKIEIASLEKLIKYFQGK